MTLELRQKKTNFCCRINKETLLGNLSKCVKNVSSVRLSSLFLEKFWKKCEQDFLRLGIDCIISDDAKVLVSMGDSVKRILEPCYTNENINCSIEGVVPILQNLNDCYALSDLAQSYGESLSFGLRIRNSAFAPYIPDENAERIFSVLSSIPMIDLDCLYLDFMPSLEDMQYLRQIIYDADCDANIDFYLPLKEGKTEFKQVKNYLTDEILGFGIDDGVFPLEISCDSYPVYDNSESMIFRCDAGIVNRLPEKFPISVDGYSSEVKKVELSFFDFEVKGTPTGPFPIKAYLIGGNEMYHADITQWDKKSLLAFIKANQFI